MTLGELVPEATHPRGAGAVVVAGLCADSRAVGPGFAFFAVPGTKADGLDHVSDAVARGAVAVVAERTPPDLPGVVALALVPDVRAALAQAAARFFPRQPETVVAVTGTSGKTSVASFVRQIWAASGRRAGSLGTLGAIGPDGAAYGTLTTPDPVALHASLQSLAGAGVTHLALEASSHGLDQLRLDGVRLAAGAFTNLSRDHLDYHADLDAYLGAKLRLFTDLLAPGQAAVVDADAAVAGTVVAAAAARKLRVFTVGEAGRDLRLLRSAPEGFATRLGLAYDGREHDVLLPLAGRFQAANALVAAGLCLATGSPAESVLAALAGLAGAPGRLERVGARRGAPVFVDYAHKPAALENVLMTLRPYAPRRLVVVFGCGGDRDAGKRPLMGAIAARLADRVIVTDDNPRSERPAAIRAAILGAAPGAREIGDRAAAIAEAIAALGPGDVLVVAGKGHETGQIVDGVTLPFSDADAIRAVLRGHAA